MARAPPPDVAAYLAACPPRHRVALRKLRAQILAASPGATEKIGYGMPGFYVDGRALVYMASFKAHCSFFPGSSGVAVAKLAGIARFLTSKGTLRFEPDDPLPDALVKRIVKLRMAENAARASETSAKARSRPRTRARAR